MFSPNFLPKDVINARKNKKITSVEGKGEEGTLKGVAPYVKDFWDIFVSRLSEETTDDQIKRHLQERGIEVKDVFMLNSKRKGTKSAKVRVVLEHKNRVKDEKLWSKHIRVQDWTHPSKSDRKPTSTALV